MNNDKVFYFLCLEKRQPAYKLITSQLEYKMVYIDTLDDLITKCIEHPPVGLFIDILTSLRFGASNIMPIDNLSMSWPVMRCNITSSGSTLVLCMDTPKRDTLQNAMKALINNDKSWVNPKNDRNHIRMKIRHRIRLREKGKDNKEWIPANGRNISTVGSFIHTYHTFQKNTTLEVELLDLGQEPIITECKVLWARSWDDTMHLPGIGVTYLEEDIQRQIKEVLTVSENIRLFLSGKL